MRKFVAMLLALVLVMSPITVFASEPSVSDSASYLEKQSNDMITIEVVNQSVAAQVWRNATTGLSDSASVTRIYRNGVYEETLYVDFDTDQLRHEYNDGTVVVQTLSDVVTIAPVEPSDDPLPAQFDELATEQIGDVAQLRTDYVVNEPIYVTSSGVQYDITGVQTWLGYKCLGYRSYEWDPATSGYLMRRNNGVSRTYYSNSFSFSAGTTIGTAVSIIVAALTSSGIVLAASIVAAVLGPIIDVVTHDWQVKFEVKQYQWLYEVRLNSYKGVSIYNTSRTKDYVKAYNRATGAERYEYRGSAYDGGYLANNLEMIRQALINYGS